MTFLRVLLVVALFLAAGAARAATVEWTNEYELGTSANGEFTIYYGKGSKAGTYNLSISPYTMLDDQIWYYNANPGSIGAIDTKMEQQFGLPLDSLSFVAKCDGVCTSGATMDPAASTGTGNVSTFTSTTAFNYLAVHIGGGELFFAWMSPQNSITLTGLPTANISNYVAFSGPVVVTPLPGAALLFASAMMLAGGVSRRRRRSGPAAA